YWLISDWIQRYLPIKIPETIRTHKRFLLECLQYFRLIVTNHNRGPVFLVTWLVKQPFVLPMRFAATPSGMEFVQALPRMNRPVFIVSGVPIHPSLPEVPSWILIVTDSLIMMI